MTNIQQWVRRTRAIYGSLSKPLLAQLAEIHGISVRQFAAIFSVSKSNAAEILSDRKDPPLSLAFKVARYYECTVDELFGWRYDDDGSRRPLVVEVDGRPMRLNAGNLKHGALALVAEVAAEMRRQDGAS